MIGVAPWLPDDFAQKYGTGSVPVSREGAYGSKARALTTLTDARDRITRAVERLAADQLERTFPDESLREVFPTVRHALVQVLVGHTSMHVGQITVWRRAMGLPPMKRSFE